MLIKHVKSFGLKSTTVKTAAALTLLIAATPMVSNAASIKQERFSVRFEKSLTQSQEGIEKVYAMFEDKAVKMCKGVKSVDTEGNRISYEECLLDTVEQLVESADIAAVKAYHAAKLSAQ